MLLLEFGAFCCRIYGVIVITTKSGKKNQETQFTLDSSFGFQEVENYIDVLNAAQYGAILNEGSVTSGGSLLFTNPSALGVGTNWQAELFDSAPISNTSISASGKHTYFGSRHLRVVFVLKDYSSNL